jgi:hypothetical protein
MPPSAKSDEIAHSGLRAAIHAHPARRTDGGRRPDDDDCSVGRQQRQRRLDGEQGALRVDVEGPVELFLSDRAERGVIADAGVGHDGSCRPYRVLTSRNIASMSERFVTSATIPEQFAPIVATASSSCSCWRSVLTTRAP